MEVIAHDMLICLRRHNIISKQKHGFLSGSRPGHDVKLHPHCQW